MNDYTSLVLHASANIDWGQHLAHRGEPCFFVDPDRMFCGRAKEWEGHSKHITGQHGLTHHFVSLNDIVRRVSKDARKAKK